MSRLAVLSLAIVPFLAPRATVAGEGPVAPWQRAEEVERAHTAGDTARVAELGRADDPDPWLVADELCGRGAREAAMAFARAAARGDVEQLPAYLEATKDFGKERAAREALATAERALFAKQAAPALEALAAAPSPRSGALAIRLRWTKAQALRASGKAATAFEEQAKAAEEAEALGWWRLAADGFTRAAGHAFRQGSMPVAKATFDRAIDAQRNRAMPQAVAEALLSRAVVETRMGASAEAVATSREALEISRGASHRAGEAAARVALGVALSRLGKSDEAVGELEQAVALYEQTDDRAGLASALAELALAVAPLGRWADSWNLGHRALQLCEELGEPLLLATVLTQFAWGLDFAGRHDESLAAFRRALDLFTKAGDLPGQADVLANLISVHEQRAEFTEAKACALRALGLQTAQGNRPGQALTLLALGRVLARLGDFGGAMERLEQARKIHAALSDTASLGSVHGALGGLHERLGDYARAARHLQQAVRLHGQVGDVSSQLSWYSDLVRVYDRWGEPEAAARTTEALYALALSKADAAGLARWRVQTTRAVHVEGDAGLQMLRDILAGWESQGNPQAIAQARRALADRLLALERHGEALPHIERARQEFTARQLAPEAADSLLLVARAQAGLKRHADARVSAQTALAEAEGLGLADVALDALAQVAASELALGRPKEALAAAHDAVNRVASLVRGQDDEGGSGARSARHGLYQTGMRAALARGDLGELYHFLESGRAGTLLEGLASREAIQAASLPPELLEHERSARRAEVAALARHQKARKEEDAAARKEAAAALKAAQQGVADAIARIQRDAKANASLLYPSVTPTAVAQASLAPAEALVLYALLEPDAVAVVLRRGEARLVKLGPSAPVREAALELAQALAGRDSDVTPLVQRLGALVLAPLALPAGVERLIVSPDGALCFVPFALLAGGREIAYAASASTHETLLAERSRRGEGVLALGNPDYAVALPEAVPEAATERGKPLAPLPFTEKEAREVGDVVLLGRQATEEGLRQALAGRTRWRSVHVACHGLFEEERPMLSCLALTAEGDDDGRWTALDIFRTRVPADLAFLSACQTGRGHFVQGEGLVGLTRAFLFAGTPRVICSLWAVDDEATQALVGEFYRRWKAEVPVARALREAQDAVKKDPRWEHPWFWAAWVLWGLPE
jgi:CHAT domain-containing protein/tetratricopeptide (TPR) repeat protein